MRELDDLILQYENQCQFTKNRYLTLLKVKEDFQREKKRINFNLPPKDMVNNLQTIGVFHFLLDH